MKCKKCGFDCYGLVDIDKKICMDCWEHKIKYKGMTEKQKIAFWTKTKNYALFELKRRHGDEYRIILKQHRKKLLFEMCQSGTTQPKRDESESKKIV